MILELLEPKRQPVPIRTILTPPPRLNHLPDDSLKPEFEESAIMDFEQRVGDVNSVIRVDADQVGVEGGMMDLALADSLWSRTGRGTAPRHRNGHGYRGRHQSASFRDAVLSAYGSRCAISHLPAPRLPDVAHINMDAEEQLGQPIVSNGLPLTSCLRSQRPLPPL